MESLVFDSSTLISISSNCMLGVLNRLRKDFDVEFLIGPSVMTETIERAIYSKKFRTEGFRLLELVKSGVLKVFEHKGLRKATDEVLKCSNSIYKAKDNYVQIIQRGEAEALAISRLRGASSIAVDERTTRLLIEDPESLLKHLGKKLHTNVEIDSAGLRRLESCIIKSKIIRSTEIIAFAFEKGYFRGFETKVVLDIEDRRYKILEGLLWGLKLEGCSISESEIKDYLSHLI